MHRLRFAAVLVACAAIASLLGVMFRHNDGLFLAVLILGIGLSAAFLAHLVLGLCARWKFHYVTICRFFALILAAIACFFIFANLTNKTDKQAARDYLKQIQPKLETYHANFGHYPDALDQLPSLPKPPAGFFYYREKDPSPDTYFIDYFSLEYSSATGQWFDDD
jgi:hypothetical protein